METVTRLQAFGFGGLVTVVLLALVLEDYATALFATVGLVVNALVVLARATDPARMTRPR